MNERLMQAETARPTPSGPAAPTYLPDWRTSLRVHDAGISLRLDTGCKGQHGGRCADGHRMFLVGSSRFCERRGCELGVGA